MTAEEGGTTKLDNLQVIHTSERGEISVGETSDGRRIVRKTGNFNTDVLQKIAAVNSPYIARVLEYSDSEIFMEFIEGEPFSQAKLPQNYIELFRELCDGVSALHAAGVIHRDIKPSNIMLCGEHIKIIDFDAARLKKPDAEKDTSFIGTDGFAPPEQYGFQQTDERSDIYSLGVTMKLLLRENYERSPIRRIAEKCMRFDPAKRYNSAAAVSRALYWRKFRTITIAAAAALVIGAAALFLLNDSSVPEVTEPPTVAASTTTAPETASQSSAPEIERNNIPEGFPTLFDDPSKIQNFEDDSNVYCTIYREKATEEEAADFAKQIDEWFKNEDIEVNDSAERIGGAVHCTWEYDRGTIRLTWTPDDWDGEQIVVYFTTKK